MTDSNVNRSGFLESERITTLDLPQNGHLPEIARRLESAMKAGTARDVRNACAEVLAIASDLYKVPPCGIRVLAARPLRVRDPITKLQGGWRGLENCS